MCNGFYMQYRFFVFQTNPSGNLHRELAQGCSAYARVYTVIDHAQLLYWFGFIISPLS